MSRQIGDIPTRTFDAGSVIFREGDDANGEAFLVHDGKVEIRKLIAGEQRILNVLKKGELLGDFALFRNAPRSATAIAVEPVTLMVIPANRLDHMVRSNPADEIQPIAEIRVFRVVIDRQVKRPAGFGKKRVEKKNKDRSQQQQ